ncbi:MAG: 6-carboxytetrahydropterin synthase QueD [Planctomycetota bacterium]|jgi:6-pyruvoyltetrahydropterin/6-carboxytetrahydropterin synthase
MLVSKEFSFNGAHKLIGYKGKCEKLHGHTWKVQVTVEAAVGEDGLAFDFIELKKIVNEKAISLLDHSFLNEVIPNPSAEHIAMWLWDQLQAHLPLHEIKVFETATSFVTYRGEGKE